jgi:hypothetical protein
MRLYPIDKSLVCLQSERRTSCQNKNNFFGIPDKNFGKPKKYLKMTWQNIVAV